MNKILLFILSILLIIGLKSVFYKTDDSLNTQCDSNLLQICEDLIFILESECTNGEFDTQCKIDTYKSLKQQYSENCSNCVTQLEYNQKLMDKFGEEGGFTYVEDEQLLLVDMNFSGLNNDDLKQVFKQIRLIDIFEGPIKRLEIDTYNNEITSYASAFYYAQALVNLEVFDINLGLNQLNDSDGIQYLKDLQLTDLLLWMEHNQLSDVQPFYNILEIDSLEFILMTLDSNLFNEEEGQLWKDAMDEKFPFSTKTVWI